MECPVCSCDNIEGVDECARCQADLSGLAAPIERSDIEKDLLNRPLGELATHHYIEVRPDCTVRDALTEWIATGQNCAIVTDAGSVVGIVTERDLLNKLFGEPALQSVENGSASSSPGSWDRPIADFMTCNPETLDAEVPVAFGLNRMMIGGYRHIPLERDGHLAGVVSVRDVLAYLTRQFADVISSDTTA